MKENLSKTLVYKSLILRHDLQQLPSLPLPAGYSFRFYQPGDEDRWLEIETSVREFLSPEEGRPAWRDCFGGKEEELKKRMLFVEDSQGHAIATATALYDQRDEKAGWVHWVAIHREHQGKGISKPLMYRVLALLRDMGYPYACIPTQTYNWLAVKVYLNCGFVPFQGEPLGWSIIRTLTGHEKLKDYPLVSEEEMYDQQALAVERQIRLLLPGSEGFAMWRDDPPRAGTQYEGSAVYFRLLPDETGGYRLGGRME